MWKRGQQRREARSPETSSCSTGIPRWGSQGLKTSQKVPFLNCIPLNWWSRPENIAWVWIDGESSCTLMDSGSTINALTPDFMEVHLWDVGPLSILSDGTLGINAFRGVFSWPLAYVIIRVQVEGVWGYNKDQVALVLPDSTGFGSWVPVTLSTPTINRIINVIKESEINELFFPLNGSRIAQLLACQWAGLSIQRETVANQTVDLTDLNKVVKTTKKEEVDTFLSKIIQGQTKTLLLGNNMHIMTQSLKEDDGPHLPHGLSVVNMYTEVISGSKWIAVVVKSLMTAPITNTKGIKGTQMVVVNVVPSVEVTPGTLEKLENWMRYRVSSRLSWPLSIGRNCSFSSWTYLA